MNREVQQALARDLTIDITTTGRKTGLPRRIEIWFHNLAGRLYITGDPGARDWYANLLADPSLIFHLKQSVRADLVAQARPVTDVAERRQIFARIVEASGGIGDLDAWVRGSPLVEVHLTLS